MVNIKCKLKKSLHIEVFKMLAQVYDESIFGKENQLKITTSIQFKEFNYSFLLEN